MDRRTAIGLILGSAAWARDALDAAFGDAQGTAVLLDLEAARVVATHRPELARSWVLPPGSTLKPFSIAALLAAGKLRADERFPCPGKLFIEGRSFNCSHPPIGAAMQADTAIAYSCNCFVAHMAQRFEAGELARFLVRQKLGAAPGRVLPALDVEARELQAIGEESVEVTPAGLAEAYGGLAPRASGAVLEGLEGAVDYGTAQLAGVRGVKVAGKTGSVVTGGGLHVAWFAGFAPSRSPRVVVVVAMQGRSGSADAAPIAGRVLAEHFGRRAAHHEA